MKRIKEQKEWETPTLTVLTSVEVNETVLRISGVWGSDDDDGQE